MNQTATPTPPDPEAELAQQIADALLKEGLIAATHRQQVIEALRSGTAKAGDWNLWVDMASEAGQSNG